MYSNYLCHYGTKRHSGRYPWGSGNRPFQRNREAVFISGSSKTQDKNSEYYRKGLPSTVKSQIDKSIQRGDRIIVGDAPGIDRQVQNYLKKKRYDNVVIYGPGKNVRYSANKKWKTKPVDAPEFEEGSKEWLAKKDIQMEKDSTSGIAIVLDEGAKATRKNIDRLLESGKAVSVYELNRSSTRLDKWLDEYGDTVIRNPQESLENYRARSANSTRQKVDSIIKSLSKDDQDKVLAGSDHYLDYQEGSHVVKRILKNVGDVPVSFFDILEDGNRTFQVALATRSGYTGSGYSSEATKQAMAWLNKNKHKLSQEEVVWGVRVDNAASIRIAEKNGFVIDSDSYSDDGKWVNYVKKLK